MKKTMMLAVLCAMAMLFAACTEKAPVPQETTATVWEGDLNEHWQVVDGTATDKAAHDVTAESNCSVCGAMIVAFGDGDGTVTFMNDKGDTTLYRSYGVGGALDREERNEYEYDEEGRMAKQTSYENGCLLQEITYQHGANGDELFALSETYYNEDGTKEVSTYSETDVLESIVYYDAVGNKEKEETFEIQYDNGQICYKKTFTDGVLSREENYKKDADGFYYVAESIRYKADGTVDGTVYFNELGEEIAAPAA